MVTGWKRFDTLRLPFDDAKILHAIDDTTAAAAIAAKQSHPGWNNVTGLAEGSVRFEPATKVGPSRFRGRFGSFDVVYVIFLELLHGHFLRNAADQEFPGLGARLRR